MEWRWSGDGVEMEWRWSGDGVEMEWRWSGGLIRSTRLEHCNIVSLIVKYISSYFITILIVSYDMCMFVCVCM